MINIDKHDWYLKSDKYPRIIHSSGFYSHQFNVLILQGSRWAKEKKTDPEITPHHYTSILGKYLYDSYNGNLPVILQDDIQYLKSDDYNRLWISFFCQYLCTDLKGDGFKIGGNTILMKTFGEPLLHSKFGEGFYGDIPQWKKYSYASYFLKYKNVDIHVGFDHRGSSIEVDDSKSPTECTEALKAFIDDIVKNK